MTRALSVVKWHRSLGGSPLSHSAPPSPYDEAVGELLATPRKPRAALLETAARPDPVRRVVAVRRQAARPRPFESLMGITPGDAEGEERLLCAIAVPVKNRGCLSRRAIVRAISRAAPTGGTVLKTLARVSAGPRAIHSAREARAGDARQPAAANWPRRPTSLIADGTTLCARHGTPRQRLTKSCAATMRIAATSLPGRHGSATAETHACDAASRRTAPFTLARSTSTVCPDHEPVGLYFDLHLRRGRAASPSGWY